MWLLDTEKLTLHEFYGREIPQYAILSHRWEEDEVTFHQLNEALKYGSADMFQWKGWRKIRNFCNVARTTFRLAYAWVDTCCIDKTSSAELSEAINSMYRWYGKAHVCIVFMSDVSSRASFGASKWFTRGWTLQELLAPTHLCFFDYDWGFIGTRGALIDEISSATGISQGSIRDPRGSVATKMSWASRRETTREEDMAYCLLGLFDVNMPLLYGEGADKAFMRLQEEIVRISNDESIFAWDSGPRKPLGLLAMSPAAFLNSRDVEIRFDNHGGIERKPYSLTHKGFQIEVQLKMLDSQTAKEISNAAGRRRREDQPAFVVPLNCYRGGERIGIILEPYQTLSRNRQIFARVGKLVCAVPPYDDELIEVYVLQRRVLRLPL